MTNLGKQKLTITLLAMLTFFVSCSTNETQINTSKDHKEEFAFAGKHGELKIGYLYGQIKVTYQLVDGHKLFSGDLVLDDQIKDVPDFKDNEAAGRADARWPNNTVYYVVNPNLSNNQRITDAINHWKNNTNLTFVVRTTQTDYIEFILDGNGPYSNSIGKLGGRQIIGISNESSTGNVIHEIGHAIGLFHEQCREDRDNFININWSNIVSGYTHNFDKYSTQLYIGFDGGPFLDFGSIMMYGPDFFSKASGLYTITKKDGSIFTIQRTALSDRDKSTINLMYPIIPFDISNWITFPVAGEYASNNSLDVYWNNAQVITKKVRIELYNLDGTLKKVINDQAPNNGEYYADIPSGTYQFKITAIDNPSMCDFSEPFTFYKD